MFATSLIGCASLLGADFDGMKGKAEASSTPGATPEAGTAPDVSPVPEPTHPDATGACPAGTKKCEELCVSPSDPKFGCGETCGASCAIPQDGVAVCRDGACAVACNTNFSECSPGVCGKLATYYEDKDGDGWGGAKAVQACASSPGLSENTGDCHDGDKNVHPGQTLYVGTPYTTPAGKTSFDYDCSGDEEPDPTIAAYKGFPMCTTSLACAAESDNGKYCWESVTAGRSGGFEKCGARAWVCLAPAGWHEASTVAALKAYPCR